MNGWGEVGGIPSMSAVARSGTPSDDPPPPSILPRRYADPTFGALPPSSQIHPPRPAAAVRNFSSSASLPPRTSSANSVSALQAELQQVEQQLARNKEAQAIARAEAEAWRSIAPPHAAGSRNVSPLRQRAKALVAPGVSTPETSFPLPLPLLRAPSAPSAPSECGSGLSMRNYQQLLKAARRNQAIASEQAAKLAALQDRISAIETRPPQRSISPHRPRISPLPKEDPPPVCRPLPSPQPQPSVRDVEPVPVSKAPSHPPWEEQLDELRKQLMITQLKHEEAERRVRALEGSSKDTSDMVPRSEVSEMLRRILAEAEMSRNTADMVPRSEVDEMLRKARAEASAAEAEALRLEHQRTAAALTNQLQELAREVARLREDEGPRQTPPPVMHTVEDPFIEERRQALAELVALEKEMVEHLKEVAATASRQQQAQESHPPQLVSQGHQASPVQISQGQQVSHPAQVAKGQQTSAPPPPPPSPTLPEPQPHPPATHTYHQKVAEETVVTRTTMSAVTRATSPTPPSAPPDEKDAVFDPRAVAALPFRPRIACPPPPPPPRPLPPPPPQRHLCTPVMLVNRSPSPCSDVHPVIRVHHHHHRVASSPSPSPCGLTTASSSCYDPNTRDVTGLTPLLRAAHEGDAEQMRRLIDMGANLECADNDGWTALHIVSQKAFEQCVVLLLNAGASANSRDCDGSTPLIIAALEGNVTVIDLLLCGNAAIDQVDDDGASALMVAAQAGNARVVERLMAHGANPGLVDRCGRAALTLARAANHADCVALLEHRSRSASRCPHPQPNVAFV